mmetsp:Transcript_20405/g.64433  ORF Transcript_20405/g.64433 Transcript_20405/m.64433 type:complete len:234 (-) Transcript_20405:239-940(-)
MASMSASREARATRASASWDLASWSCTRNAAAPLAPSAAAFRAATSSLARFSAATTCRRRLRASCARSSARAWTAARRCSAACAEAALVWSASFSARSAASSSTAACACACVAWRRRSSDAWDLRAAPSEATSSRARFPVGGLISGLAELLSASDARPFCFPLVVSSAPWRLAMSASLSACSSSHVLASSAQRARRVSTSSPALLRELSAGAWDGANPSEVRVQACATAPASP